MPGDAGRVLTVARTDFRRAVRGRLLWVAVVLLGAMSLPSTANTALGRNQPLVEYILLVPLDLVSFVLVVVGVVGYSAVAGERAAETVRFTLGLPVTRRDLVLGKLLARCAVAAVAVGVVLAVTLVLFVVGYGTRALLPGLVMGAGILVYTVGWTAVAVGFSAAFESAYRALGALALTFAAFSPSVGIWEAVSDPVFSLAFTGSLGYSASYEALPDAPVWIQVSEQLNPVGGFFRALHWTLDGVGPGTPTGPPALWLFGVVVFVAFSVFPAVVGLRRFERADLDGGGGGATIGQRLRGVLPALTGRLSPGARATGDRSRVVAVALADIRHAVQHWVVAGTVLLVLLLTLPRFWETLDTGGISTVQDVFRGLPSTVALPALVLGVALGYRAVVGEREAGTARFALSLPITRREFVRGTYLGRLAVLGVVLAVLLVVGEAFVLVRLGRPYPAAFLAWAGTAVWFALVWTTFVVGVSAAVATRFRALAAAFGTFLVFDTGFGLWTTVVRPALALAFGGSTDVPDSVYGQQLGPLWFRYTDHLNPLVALRYLQEGALGAAGFGTFETTVPLTLYCLLTSGLFAVGTLWLGTRRFVAADLG